MVLSSLTLPLPSFAFLSLMDCSVDDFGVPGSVFIALSLDFKFSRSFLTSITVDETFFSCDSRKLSTTSTFALIASITA